MAHSCWAPNEIVSAIAANLVLDKATASAVALARCCRSFEDPVLCEVWRSLSSLAPLVKCLPPEVWGVKDGKLFFKRAPFHIEWTRFQQQYASKVRRLVVSSPDAVISSAALQLLQLYSQCSPLLPNLVWLDWNSDDENLPFITSFFSHSLTSISIDIDVAITAERVLPPILMILPTMVPDISKIEVKQLACEPSRSMEEASSQLLMQCNPHRLRTYYVDAPLSASALSRVIQLPLLEELWLVGPIRLPVPLPDVVFPSLQELDIEFDEDLAWLKLLPESPLLSAIYVECPGPDVEQFVEAFQLTLTGCGMHERLKQFRVRSRDEFKITPQIIACHLSFRNLTSLDLLSDCSTSCQTLDLTDADIDLLTNAMPGLKSLAIGEQPCSVLSKMTFNSLYTISRRCTRLTSLQIHFNPESFITKVNGSENRGFETLSSDLCSVTMINVGSIVLPSQSKVSYIMASGLLGVFPRLEEVEYDDVAWEEIDSLINLFRCIHTTLVRG